MYYFNNIFTILDINYKIIYKMYIIKFFPSLYNIIKKLFYNKVWQIITLSYYNLILIYFKAYSLKVDTYYS